MAAAGRSGSKAGFGLTPIDENLPFAVDTWSATTAHKHQFLTHAHKDHLSGIEEHARRVHCTEATAQLLEVIEPAAWRHLTDEGALVTLQLHEPCSLHHEGIDFTVTALPAGHCEGSAMYLFTSPVFGTILHTGDARLTPDLVHMVKQRLEVVEGGTGRPHLLDLLYLDCTGTGSGGQQALAFLEEEKAVQALLRLIETRSAGTPAPARSSLQL